MRKLIAITFLTLDGVMQAPGGPDEDNEGGFKYGGWQMSYSSESDEDDDTVSREMTKAGALLLGRKTYDIFAAYWPNAGKDIEVFGPFMNNVTKYVASKTLHKTEWQNSNLLKGDVAEAVGRIKEEPGKDIYMFGSGNLLQTLMQQKLVDEHMLMIYPMALGSGKRLFQPDGPKQDFELVKSRTTQSGVLVLNYRVKR